MRSVLAISALLVAFSAAPAAARDYPWCARTITNGFSGDCSFTSYQQCMATVSGQRGECMQNPRIAYDQARGWRKRPSSGDTWQNGNWQDNGWNNRW
jgi:uncharacterized protein DUF3551